MNFQKQKGGLGDLEARELNKNKLFSKKIEMKEFQVTIQEKDYFCVCSALQAILKRDNTNS